MKTKKVRILLADDHKLVRDGLALLIKAHPDMEVVGEAGDGKEALAKALALNPEIVIMDLSMPQMNGLQVTEALMRARPAIKVLVLTTHEDPSYLRQLCQAKAVGYVLKRSAGTELIEAIRKVAAGEVHFDAALAGKALARKVQDPNGKGEMPNCELSERETEVLRRVAMGYSNKEVADQLSLSVKTVETYKVRVGQKLGLRSRAEMVQFALRRGWLDDQAVSPRLAS